MKDEEARTDPQAPCIRPACRDDLPALLPLVEGLARDHDDLPRLTAASLAEDLFGPHPWFYVLVAEDAYGLIGYAALLPLARLQHGERGLDLHHLYIRPDQRNRGHGKALLCACEDLARQLGCRYVIIGTAPDNTRAHAFYEAAAYQPIPNPARRFHKRL